MTQPGSKRPTTARDNRVGMKNVRTSAGNVPVASGLVVRHPVVAEETIEDRLQRKAVFADRHSVTGKSLGQMSREQRHKLLYGE